MQIHDEVYNEALGEPNHFENVNEKRGFEGDMEVDIRKLKHGYGTVLI
jgi:hypothetical protein